MGVADGCQPAKQVSGERTQLQKEWEKQGIIISECRHSASNPARRLSSLEKI